MIEAADKKKKYRRVFKKGFERRLDQEEVAFPVLLFGRKKSAVVMFYPCREKHN